MSLTIIAEKISKTCKERPKLFLWSLFFVATIFSLVVIPGYKVFISDQAIYLPAVYQLLDPALFRNDILLSFNQSSFTLFDEILAAMTKFFSGDMVLSLFLLTFFFRLIYIYAVYLIAFYFSRIRWLSLLAVLLVLSGFNVYGTAAGTFDVFLTPRFIGTALGLLSLAAFLYGKPLFAAIALGVGILFHPITVVIFVIIFYVVLLMVSDLRLKEKIVISLVPVVFGLILLLTSKSAGLGFFVFIDRAWAEVIQYRNPSVFISLWPTRYSSAFLYLAVDALIFAIARAELKDLLSDRRKRFFFNLFFWAPLILFALSFLAVDVLMLHFFVQLQLARALLIWKIFTPFLMLLLAVKFIREKPRDIIYNFSLAGILSAFILKESLIFIFFPLFFFLWFERRYNIARFLSPMVFRFFLVSLVLASSGVLLWWWERHYYLDNVLTLALIWLAAAFFTVAAARPAHLRPILKAVFVVAAFLIFAAGIRSFSIYPDCQRRVADVGLVKWVEANTKKDAVFLTEPFSSQDESSILRICALRNVFFSKKDGAQAAYNRNYALEWQKRGELIKDLKQQPQQLEELLKLYQVDYIVSRSGDAIGKALVFSNGKYFIYAAH